MVQVSAALTMLSLLLCTACQQRARVVAPTRTCSTCFDAANDKNLAATLRRHLRASKSSKLSVERKLLAKDRGFVVAVVSEVAPKRATDNKLSCYKKPLLGRSDVYLLALLRVGRRWRISGTWRRPVKGPMCNLSVNLRKRGDLNRDGTEELYLAVEVSKPSVTDPHMEAYRDELILFGLELRPRLREVLRITHTIGPRTEAFDQSQCDTSNGGLKLTAKCPATGSCVLNVKMIEGIVCNDEYYFCDGDADLKTMPQCKNAKGCQCPKAETKVLQYRWSTKSRRWLSH